MVVLMKGNRSLSYSEIAAAITCQARHAFAYTGHLTGGDTLKRKALAVRLSDGRAWGAGVAAWNATGDRWAAQQAMLDSYDSDFHQQLERGIRPPMFEVMEQRNRLGAMLSHHMEITRPLDNLIMREHEFLVSIPSRTGRRGSTRYKFVAKIDGYTIKGQQEAVVEYKLRARLSDPKMIELSRQTRWYCWAQQQVTDLRITEVIVEERLNELPKPARIVQGAKKGTFTVSHAKDQLTTAELYVAACEEFEVEPKPDVVESLRQRKWVQRITLPFRPSELEESGLELVSAAETIRDLDSGQRYPIRNAQAHICGGCDFKDICANPHDKFFVDTRYVRGVPKRNKGALVTNSSSDAHSDGKPAAAHHGKPGDPSELVLQAAPFASASAGSHELVTNAPKQEVLWS